MEQRVDWQDDQIRVEGKVVAMDGVGNQMVLKIGWSGLLLRWSWTESDEGWLLMRKMAGWLEWTVGLLKGIVVDTGGSSLLLSWSWLLKRTKEIWIWRVVTVSDAVVDVVANAE